MDLANLYASKLQKLEQLFFWLDDNLNFCLPAWYMLQCFGVMSVDLGLHSLQARMLLTPACTALSKLALVCHILLVTQVCSR